MSFIFKYNSKSRYYSVTIIKLMNKYDLTLYQRLEAYIIKSLTLNFTHIHGFAFVYKSEYGAEHYLETDYSRQKYSYKNQNPVVIISGRVSYQVGDHNVDSNPDYQEV